MQLGTIMCAFHPCAHTGTECSVSATGSNADTGPVHGVSGLTEFIQLLPSFPFASTQLKLTLPLGKPLHKTFLWSSRHAWSTDCMPSTPVTLPMEHLLHSAQQPMEQAPL